MASKSSDKVNRSSGRWIPEIVYEDVDGVQSQIPTIYVPKNCSKPNMLFIFVSEMTGEVEPDSRGREVPVVDIQLHTFANMQVLQTKLSAEAFDDVRKAMGLDPLSVAIEKGKKINDEAHNVVAEKAKETLKRSELKKKSELN